MDEVFSGRVKSIAPGRLVINSTTQAPFEDKPTVIENSFILGSQTEYLQETQKVKSEEQFKKEEKKISDAKTIAGTVIAPRWFVDEKISADNLKIGDELRVIYFNDNGIFKAKQILLLNPTKEKKLLDADEMLRTTESKIEGSIISIEDHIFKIDICSELIIASSSCEQREKTISIDEKTKIIRKEIKTETDFQKEQADFQDKFVSAEKSGEGSSQLKAPGWYNEIPGKISDLKPGMKISVVLNGGDAENISASVIYYQ